MKLVPPRVQQLKKVLQSNQIRARYDAIEVLRQMDDPAVVRVLIELLGDDNEGIRASATRALGEIYKGTKQAVLALIKCLKDESPLVRYFAIEALRRIEDPDAIPALIKSMNDEVPFVRNSAVTALKRISTVNALKSVEELFG